MSLSKRQLIKEKRRQERRRQRVVTILIISGVALFIAALLAAPTIQNALTPVGEIVQITPEERPMVDGRALGDPDAPVRIEVYEDFQCPACRTFSSEIEPLLVANYVAGGQVRYIFRHFPFLDDQAAGNESDQAANASMCAAEQGRFWDYHDMLFANWNGENRGAFLDKRLVAFAEALDLDINEFNDCFEQDEYEDVIAEDLALGRQNGVNSTPTILVNGKQVISATPRSVPSFQEIEQVVQTELSQSSK